MLFVPEDPDDSVEDDDELDHVADDEEELPWEGRAKATDATKVDIVAQPKAKAAAADTVEAAVVAERLTRTAETEEARRRHFGASLQVHQQAKLLWLCAAAPAHTSNAGKRLPEATQIGRP